MPEEPVVTVWSPWRLHADAVTVGLVGEGVAARVVDDPDAAGDVLVLGAVVPEVSRLIRRRRAEGGTTMVWGGTLPSPRIADLRSAGAAAYVSMLVPPAEVADVVRRVIAGCEVAWPHAPPPMSALTPRELEVARAYLVTGAERSRAAVARGLGISERTLKVHVANIRAKTGHDGTATREGLRHELVARRWLS